MKILPRAAARRETCDTYVDERGARVSDMGCRAVFEQTDDIFVVCAAVLDGGDVVDFVLEDVNPAFQALLGPGGEQAGGRRVTEVLPWIGQDPMTWIEALRDVIASGRPGHMERHVAPLDRWYRISVYRAGPAHAAFVGHDVTQRRKMEAELREREARERARAVELQGVLDAVPAVVFIARDRGAQRIDPNGAAEEMLRVRPRANVSMGAPTGERPEHVRVMRDGVDVPPEDMAIQVAARTGAEVRDWAWDLVFEDGTTRHLLGNATPLLDERGEPRGAVGAFLDITERKRAADALAEADRRKSEFLAVLSHELRNPLSSIHYSLYLLKRAGRTEEQAGRALSVLERQVQQLSRLVDDLLDVTRLSRGKIELKKTTLELSELVLQVAEDHRSLFLDKGVRLGAELRGHPLHVRGDPARLKQIIGNLLWNAVKFTDPGGEVVLSLDREGARSSAVIRVRDTGIGIEPGVLQGLFEPFVQADVSLARSSGGLGLGLALVKGLVDMHGGSVTGASEGAGKGAEFTVRLPVEEEQPPAEVPRRSAAEAKRRRILVIDDSEDAAEMLKEALEIMGGHEVETANDALSGLEKVRALRPDVVLCDIGLPGTDGYAVARAVRSDPSNGRVFLVALTGYASPEDRQRAIEAGFDRHLAKPPSLEQLEEAVTAG